MGDMNDRIMSFRLFQEQGFSSSRYSGIDQIWVSSTLGRAFNEIPLPEGVPKGISDHQPVLAKIGLYGESLSQGSLINQDELLFSDDFEDGLADGWELAEGWQVIQDQGNYVLSGDGLYQWSRLHRGFDWTNYTLKCRLQLISGGVHLNFRMQDEPDEFTRYFIGFRENTLYLSKENPPGNYTGLTDKAINFDLGVWHDVEIVGTQGYLKIYVDGNLELEYNDPDYLPQGRIAFETIEESADNSEEGSNAYIDYVEVWRGETPRTPTP